MSLNLTALTRAHKNQLRKENPFIWLFGVETLDDPPQRYRFTSFPQIVHFGTDSDGLPIKWYPAPITHGGIEHDGEGGLPSIDITLANASLEIAPVVDSSIGFVGQPCEIHVVSSLELDNPDASVSEIAEVIDCAMNPETVTFSVSAFNLYEAQFPPFLYRKFTCRWKWGGVECAYNPEVTGAGYEDCGVLVGGTRAATGFTLEACTLQGDDEEANVNVGVRQHPRRIGLYPGIPRPGRR